MTEQKIEFDAECFGTIDKEKKAHCHQCNYSEQCSEFKPKLAAYKENAVQSYVNKEQQKKQDRADKKTADQNHYLVSLTVLLVMGLVFWMVFKTQS